MGVISVIYSFAKQQHKTGHLQKVHPFPADWKSAEKPLCKLFEYLHEKGVFLQKQDKMQDIYTFRAFIRLRIAQLQFDAALHPCDASKYEDEIDKLEEVDKFLEKYNFPKLNQEK